MTTQILDWMKWVRANIITGTKLDVLEIGSMDMNGSARYLFEDPESHYVGCDMMSGKGVEVVLNGHDALHFFRESGQETYPKAYDVTLCLETLEHDVNFWITLENLRELTKPGGYMVITTPTFKFPIHRHPYDYYRFGEDTYRHWFFRDWDILDLREVLSKGVNPGIVCVGRKPA